METILFLQDVTNVTIKHYCCCVMTKAHVQNDKANDPYTKLFGGIRWLSKSCVPLHAVHALAKCVAALQAVFSSSCMTWPGLIAACR